MDEKAKPSTYVGLENSGTIFLDNYIQASIKEDVLGYMEDKISAVKRSMFTIDAGPSGTIVRWMKIG